MKNPKNIEKFVNEALAMQTEEAREAGSLGFFARALTQATMPHSKPRELYFTRENGGFSLTMMSNPKCGLPYGTIPRLLISWMTTEAVQTKTPELVLGDSLSGFLKELGLMPTGGRWGSITRVKTQMDKLFSCFISCTFTGENERHIYNVVPVTKANLWWSPKQPEQASLFDSTITLSQEFFQEIVRNPIVFRLEALKLLSKSPMAIDLYIWVTYRNSYIRKPTYIPWEALQMQFGAGYPFTVRGKLDFKKKFLEALKKVAIAYPDAGKLRDEGQNLLFIPGRPDVPKTII